MAHPDLNTLMNVLLPFAQQMLGKHGEFFPFGAIMKQDGEIVHHGAYDGDEQPPSQRLIDLITQAFQKLAAEGEIRAAAICCDVRVARPGQTEKVDAVEFALEHQSGEAVNVFLPYNLDSSSEVCYGELFASRRDRHFFLV